MTGSTSTRCCRSRRSGRVEQLARCWLRLLIGDARRPSGCRLDRNECVRTVGAEHNGLRVVQFATSDKPLQSGMKLRIGLSDSGMERVMTARHQTIDEPRASTRWANTNPQWITEFDLKDWGWPENAVHGESFRQDAVRSLSAVTEMTDGVRLDLVVVEFRREPSNPVDAAACMALVEGRHVGYLAAEYAAELSPIVDAAGIETWKVAGAIVGGTDGAPSFGVHVWLCHRLTPGPREPTVPLRPHPAPA
jgi:hypothetical protein